MSQTCRVANLLGALSLAVTDSVRRATETKVAHGGETPAGLVVVGHAPGLSNDALAHVLGLSHAGTVRTVDRLAQDGLLHRRPSATDRRAVALHLTPLGRKRRRAALAERAQALAAVVAVLSPEEQATLDGLLAKLLAALPRTPMQALSLCRLCDEESCDACPVDAAVAALRARGEPRRLSGRGVTKIPAPPAAAPRQAQRPPGLAGRRGDQILPDLDRGVQQVPPDAVHRHGVVRLGTDRVRLVVAHHQVRPPRANASSRPCASRASLPYSGETSTARATPR